MTGLPRLAVRPKPARLLDRARDWCALNRRDWIVLVLERWDELGSLSPASGARGGGGWGALQPHEPWCGVFETLRCDCWLRQLAVLAGWLWELRRLCPSHYRHLEARYGQAVKRRRRYVRFKAGQWEGLERNEAVLIPRFDPGSRGTRERVYDDVLVARWPVWVQPVIVDRALDWLAQRFEGEPALPREAVAA